MSNNNSMTDLVKNQEEEKKSFAGGVFLSWQALKQRESESLGPYNNAYDKAPEHVRARLDKDKENFTAEWGSQGRLAGLMEERHQKARDRLAIQGSLMSDIQKKRSNDQGNDR